MRTVTRSRVATGLLAALLAASSAPVGARQADEVPPELDQVGVEERLDTTVPTQVELVDQEGRTVRLGDFLDGERPVILTLNYYTCAMLCTLQLNGLTEGMRELSWTPGDEFDVVTLSINPNDTPTVAKLKQQSYVKSLGRPEAARGWHFLTGSETAIRRVADAVGFSYAWVEETGEYAHAATAVMLTPSGRVARYLYGIEYRPRDLRLALLEASEGRIGSPWDQLIMYCFHYDPDSRSYAPVAMNLMRLGAGATVAILGVTLGGFWVRERRRSTRRGRDDS